MHTPTTTTPMWSATGVAGTAEITSQDNHLLAVVRAPSGAVLWRMQGSAASMAALRAAAHARLNSGVRRMVAA